MRLRYEQPDIWSKYLRRPASVKDMCLAQFAKMYKKFNPKKGNQEEDEIDLDIAVNIEEISEDEVHDDSKFHFIMTSEDNGRKGTKLPDMLLIKDPYPGEAPFMKKRQQPAALRFHKFKKDNDHKRFMRSEIMLYYPLVDEVAV